MRALDLFSAAAGGWTLGLHRAGFAIGGASLRTEAALATTMARGFHHRGDRP